MENFARVFVAQFAVLNVTPVLPLVLSYARTSTSDSRGLLRTAWTTSMGAGIGLVLLGPVLLGSLGITHGDLRVAGGVILLVFATYDLLFSRIARQADRAAPPTYDLGVVPLGVPILLGPAGMTALLVTSQVNGMFLALGVFIVNQFINGLLLLAGGRLVPRLGAVAEVIGKLMALVLAGLAVSMLRLGITSMF